MTKLSRVVLLLAIVVALGATVFLATWQIPAPRTMIEKVIPDDRFPR